MRSYAYTYDALNRIKTAKYSQINNDRSCKFNERINNYDRNGNILGLFRYTENPNNANLSIPIDNLTYTYDKGNKLMKVDDDYKSSSYGAEGFKDGTNTGNDYSYDANGNMTRDYNKGIGTSSTDGITSVSYTHLTLPTKRIV